MDGPNKEFKEYVVTAFKDNPKTAWGKREIALYLEQLWSEYLQGWIEKH